VRRDLFIWTPRQRLALASILLAVVAVLLVLASRRPLHINDPQPPAGRRANELATRIDPNHADWPTLAALPHIGEKRAKDIIAYRDQFSRDNPQRQPFTTLQDLEKVPGIGPATAESLAPYLLLANEPARR
jgi:competence protein ComEA